MRIELSKHAREEMKRRGIPEDIILSVLNTPQQITSAYGGRHAHQSKMDFGSGKVYLVRAIVEQRKDHLFVVTVYRTSKFEKYWEKR